MSYEESQKDWSKDAEKQSERRKGLVPNKADALVPASDNRQPANERRAPNKEREE
jgi:hypothetical protein